MVEFLACKKTIIEISVDSKMTNTAAMFVIEFYFASNNAQRNTFLHSNYDTAKIRQSFLEKFLESCRNAISS